jgi:SSS family solute:Na+ symporter
VDAVVDNYCMIALILYMVVVISIGALSAKRSKGIEGFYLAGRGLGGILLTATLCATIVGASSTLGMAGLGFKEGLTGAWWMLSGAIGLVILSSFFAEKVRTTGCYTLPELVGSQYDERVRTAASLLIVISWIGVISAQIIASGRLLGTLFEGNESLFMIISGAVFILYTAHGGQHSIVKTDLLQFVILFGGILLIFSRMLDVTGAGILGNSNFPVSPARGTLDVISLILVVGSTYIVGPDIYSRLLSAHSPMTARRSAMAAAIILVPLAFIITFLGVGAACLFPGIEAEQALPVLMMQILSPLEIGILAAALLAALMSSADTTLLTATSIFTLDLYKRARPKSSESHLMKVSRGGIIFLGSLALAFSLYSPGIIATLLSAYTIFAGGMIVPVIAGFYKDKLGLTSTGALAALIGGGMTAMLFGKEYPLLGMAVSAALLFIISRLAK